jgi:hypothetical protein
MLKTQQELDPWEIEVAFYTNERGFNPDEARIFMMLRWIYTGDLRPLEAAIVEGREIDRAVLNLLADMISSDTSRLGKPPPYRLKAEKLRRGRPKKPELFARRIVAAREYERHAGNSDEGFERIAKEMGTSPRTVRQAVTAFRKAHNNCAK